MAFRQLISAFTNPIDFLTRVANLEAEMEANEAVGSMGTHHYTPFGCPASLSAGGTSTQGVANQIWLSEIRLSSNVLLTGVSFLIGGTGGTDKAVAILYDSSGNVLAWSASAGATVGTASTFQRLAFTQQYQAAPGLYYVGIQTNGTTAYLQTQPAGDHNTGVDGTQTFGALAKTTPPTTFTAAKGPICMLY